MSEIVQEYLELNPSYAQFLGKLGWARFDGAIEYEDGRTFAFSESIAQFVEGFASVRPLIPFIHLVHLMELLSGASARIPRLSWIHQTMRESGLSYRNAGALAAVLCPATLNMARPIDHLLVCDHLRRYGEHVSWVRSWYPRVYRSTEWPPLEPRAFEEQVLGVLQRYSHSELRSWFRHGRGPIKGDALLPDLPPAQPRTLEGLVDALLKRARLAGAERFLPQLVSALSLPPRRLDREPFPVGGYADLATHGQPDQILPSQFALDGLEFARRLAEKELLYFRREEPPVHQREELVVLLDQGVRTWGDVRLVLAGAALALVRLAERRGTPLLLATTSSRGNTANPLTFEQEALGERLEASDLSPHPAAALERVLEEPVQGPRDVVLLTQPRNLQEVDVGVAARRAGAQVRLFAVTVDAEGNAELSEWGRRAAVRLRQFRIDWSPSGGSRTPALAERTTTAWQGDVEPIGFPFRFGNNEAFGKDLLDFDQHGEWLLAVTRRGIPYAWRTDAAGMEVLPRAMFHGILVTDIRGVVGVIGGFVVVGVQQKKIVGIHYDLARRCATAYELGTGRSREWRWHYSADMHSLVAFKWAGPAARTGCAIDLANGGRYQPNLGGPPRALQAWDAAQRAPLSVAIDIYGGVLVQNAQTEWRHFLPQEDGQYGLKSRQILRAQSSADVLAIKTWHWNPQQYLLRLFRGPDGAALGEFPTSPDQGFVLSRDGRKLARQSSSNQIVVHEVFHPETLPMRTEMGGFTNPAHMLLGKRWLMISGGGPRGPRFQWKTGPLEVLDSVAMPSDETAVIATRRPWVPGTYDPGRYRLVAFDGLYAVADRFGQVAMLDVDKQLVCMFFTHRGSLAVWMPDGTRYGPASITGGPPTHGALQKIGRALRAASERGGG